MNLPPAALERELAERRSVHAIIGKILLNVAFIALAFAALAAYEHFKIAGQSTPSLVSLVAAGGFGLMPVRALLDELLEIEGKVMHLIHGFGGLAVVGLASTGVISGGSVLTHGAMAPFAIMGAAQALMHSDHPRSPDQADALRGFAASLPAIREFSAKGALTSPDNAQRAVAVLADILAKAQRLGETELRSDPGFQGALRQITTKTGVSLGLDAIDHALATLAGNPATAAAVPQLRRQLADARRAVNGGAAGVRPSPRGDNHG
jgi:hypothetical protein